LLQDRLSFFTCDLLACAALNPVDDKEKELFMRLLQDLGAHRNLPGLVLLGLVVVMSGCNMSGEATYPLPPGNSPGQIEREARLKAYGTTGNPKVAKNTAKHGSKRSFH